MPTSTSFAATMACSKSPSVPGMLVWLMLGCRSGSAADTQLVCDHVRNYMEQHALTLDDSKPTVSAGANLCAAINYNNKDMLMAGMIVAGWDKYEGGVVYALPIGGSMVKVPGSRRGRPGTRAATRRPSRASSTSTGPARPGGAEGAAQRPSAETADESLHG